MIPFTYYLGFDNLSTEQQAAMLDEFVCSGGENLVLTDGLLAQFCGKPQLRKVFYRQIEQAGIKLVDAHSPYGPECDLMQPDDNRKVASARQKLVLELVQEAGVDTCCFHLGNSPAFMEYKLDELHTFICRTLEILLKQAEELKVTICIENIFKPLNTVSEILELLKKFDSPYLGVCYDAGHANLMTNGKDYPEGYARKWWEPFDETPDWNDPILEKMLPHIVNCHLHDNDGSSDQHKLCGTGSVDWKKVVSLLKTAPNLKNIQCESLSHVNNFSIREMIETTRAVLN